MKIQMVNVDPNNDFLVSGDEPLEYPTPFGGRRRGALYVEGAAEEGHVLGELIRWSCEFARRRNIRLGSLIEKIHPTIDSHHRNDASHHHMWVDQNGTIAPPFTIVSNDDVVNFRWRPRFPFAYWEGKPIPSSQWARIYTAALEKDGRSMLTLWPIHCQVQTWGQSVYHPVQEAYDVWTEATCSYLNYITKGYWPWSEHYSAIKAEVIDGHVPDTDLNKPLLDELFGCDQILWGGWAGSHCLRWTFEDAVKYFTNQGKNEFVEKSIIFEDCSAAVADIAGAPVKFSDWRKKFLDDAVSRGARVITTKQYMAEMEGKTAA